MEKWVLYAIISMLFVGITSVVAKLGMKDMSSDSALVFRTSVIFIIVLANAFLLRNVIAELQNSPKQNLIWLAISGVTAALSWIFYFRALKEGLVSYVTFIDKASVLVTLLLSFIILKEPLTPKLLMGSAFILVGMLILVWK